MLLWLSMIFLGFLGIPFLLLLELLKWLGLGGHIDKFGEWLSQLLGMF